MISMCISLGRVLDLCMNSGVDIKIALMSELKSIIYYIVECKTVH